MATPGAEFVTLRRKTSDDPRIQEAADLELQELEREIAGHRDRPLSALLKEVVERVNSITKAGGTAIALHDQWGITCRASVGEAPEIGSRLRPDSALTRECFETGQIVVCEDTETDYRVRRSTARSLRLRSALVVPLKTEAAILGVIEVLSSHPSAFSPAHIEGLQRVSHALSEILAPSPEKSLPVEEMPVEKIDGAALATAAAEPDEAVVRESVEVPLAPVSALPKKSNSRFKTALAVVILLLLCALLYFAFSGERLRRRVATPAPTAAPPSVQQSAPPIAAPSEVDRGGEIQNMTQGA